MFPCYLQNLLVLPSFQFLLLQTKNYLIYLFQLKPSFSFLTYDVEILLYCQDIGNFLLCVKEEKDLLPKNVYQSNGTF